MSTAPQTITDFVPRTCGECGVQYCMTRTFYEQRQRDGITFYCPNGHGRCFTETEIIRAKKETEALRKRLEWEQQESKVQRGRADAAERRSRSLRGHATRLRKRIAEGKCPCCSKAFPDMASHIAEKHPRYMPADEG